MTRFAQFLLVLTSLAPVGLVYAGVSFDHRHTDLVLPLLAGTLLLLTLCGLLLFGLSRGRASAPRKFTDPVPKEAEPLAFLVAYALPLISAKDDSPSICGILVFVVLMALAIWQLQIIYVNPLLAILGYSFVTAKMNDGTPALIITRKKTLPAGILHAIAISDYLWLHQPKAGGVHGPSAHDPKE
jgi:hypothetical protein